MRRAEAEALQTELLRIIKARPGITLHQIEQQLAGTSSAANPALNQHLLRLRHKGAISNILACTQTPKGKWAVIAFWYAPHKKNARGLAERAAATAQRNARLAKAKALAAKAKALAAKAKARAEKQAAQAKLAQEIKAARGQEAIDEEPHECTASDMKGVGPEDLAWMAYWSQPKTQRLAMTAP